MIIGKQNGTLLWKAEYEGWMKTPILMPHSGKPSVRVCASDPFLGVKKIHNIQNGTRVNG